MENELTLYEAQQVSAVPFRNGYKISCGNAVSTLKRDVDFGVIPGTKKPSLFKSGAEKIARDCGMLQHYTIESKIEDAEKPFFFYNVKCELVKVSNDGKEYVFYTAYGSANTLERRNGRNGAFDAANATLKMAQKRSLVSAVVSMGALSDLFTMDLENEDFMNGYKEIANTQDPNAPVTAAQIKRLYAIANDNGYNAKEAKKILAENGVTDTKAIKQGEYDKVCDLFKKE